MYRVALISTYIHYTSPVIDIYNKRMHNADFSVEEKGIYIFI